MSVKVLRWEWDGLLSYNRHLGRWEGGGGTGGDFTSQYFSSSDVGMYIHAVRNQRPIILLDFA